MKHLTDCNQVTDLAPAPSTTCRYSVDPVLNRGVVLESLGRYSEAASDYQAVLAAEPNDPAAWNNLGNVASAQGKWQEALDSYGRAVRLAPGEPVVICDYFSGGLAGGQQV